MQLCHSNGWSRLNIPVPALLGTTDTLVLDWGWTVFSSLSGIFDQTCTMLMLMLVFDLGLGSGPEPEP